MSNNLPNKSVAYYIQDVYGSTAWVKIKTVVDIENPELIYNTDENKII